MAPPFQRYGEDLHHTLWAKSDSTRPRNEDEISETSSDNESHSGQDGPGYGAETGQSYVFESEKFNSWLAEAPGVLQEFRLSQQWVRGKHTTCTLSLELDVSPEEFIRLFRLVALVPKLATQMNTKRKASEDLKPAATLGKRCRINKQ